MGQTLTNGIYLPDEGERNSYSGLEANWRTLDALILTINGKAAPNIANTWTAAQTFTAGIAGDLTGNVTGTASKAIADEDGTNIKSGYVNVAGNQTVTGNKDWTGTNRFAGLTIKDSVALANGDYGQAITYRDNQGNRHAYIQPYKNTSGVVNLAIGVDNSGSVQLNSSLIPYATNVLSLGSSSYQWKSVYSQTYYYNGTAWGLDQTNNWTGSNIFTGSVILPAFGSNNYKNYGIVTDYGYTQSNNYYRFLRTTGVYNTDNTPDTSKPSFLTFRPNRLQTELMDNIQVCNSGTNNYLAPITNNATDLGTSTKKWKTLNGVNPGALGMPGSSYVEIDTTNWDLTGASSQSYTPAVHGWLYISIQNIAGNYLSIVGGRGAVSMDGTGAQAGLRAMLPVIANESISITIKTGSIFAARFYPMLGNV